MVSLKCDGEVTHVYVDDLVRLATRETNVMMKVLMMPCLKIIGLQLCAEKSHVLAFFLGTGGGVTNAEYQN